MRTEKQNNVQYTFNFLFLLINVVLLRVSFFLSLQIISSLVRVFLFLFAIYWLGVQDSF